MRNIERNSQIGARVRFARDLAGLTQEQLADLVGMKGPDRRSVIGDIEHGRRGLSLKTLIAIAHALDVNPAWLDFGRPFAKMERPYA